MNKGFPGGPSDQQQSGGDAPATTAINDFQVGDGAGNWIKKTLAQTATILQSLLDSVYSAAGHTHSYQPLDPDLTDISGLSPADDDILQRKSGVWINRTLAQLITDITSAIQTVAKNIIEDFYLSGDITIALTGDQDDWSPTGLATASTIRISANTDVVISGITGGADGRILLIQNVDTGIDNIILSNEDAASSAANRFALAGEVILEPSQGIVLRYDATSSRWRQIGREKSSQDILDLGGANYAPIAKGVTNGDSHNHVGGDGDVIYYTQILPAHGANGTIAAGATSYTPLFFSALSTTPLAFTVDRAGTIELLSMWNNSAQPASGSLVVTVMKDGVASAITLTYVNADGVAYKQDTTHSFSVVAGNFISIRHVNNASGASAQINGVTLAFRAATS